MRTVRTDTCRLYMYFRTAVARVAFAAHAGFAHFFRACGATVWAKPADLAGRVPRADFDAVRDAVPPRGY